jgi:V/A-type H+-transporting ATPase subunit E
MQNKLQELTEKIYREGISKGNAEAEEIVLRAKKEAEALLADAKKESKAILNEAQKKAEEIRTNGESELKLSARQSINALKQKIVDLINHETVNKAVEGALQDKDFVRRMLETTLKNWAASSDKPLDVNLLLPEKEVAAMEQYFVKSVKELLDKGLSIKADAEIKAGFQIVPKDGSYKMSFTDRDFENFFKGYLRPRLMKLLFAGE